MEIPHKVIESITRRESDLENDRTSFDALWADERKFILPFHGRSLHGQESNEDTDGTLLTHNIYDGTATRALGVTAAGMQAGINSPARPWFKLGYADKQLSEYKPVRLWLDQVESLVRDIYSRSNVYNMLHRMYLELICFGTAASAIRPDFNTIIRGRPYTIGEYWLGLDHGGKVDTCLRKFRMTALQMVNMFGIDNVSQAVKSAYENKNAETRFTVNHFVEPNDGRLKIPFGDGMPYRCVYHEKGFENDNVLSVRHSEVFPILAPRWNTVAMMAYGFGPGAYVLNDVKGLQKEKEKFWVGIDKAVDPPLVGPGSLADKVVNTMPGGITYDDSLTQNAGLRPLYQMNVDYNGATMSIQDTRNAIRQGLFTDLFTLIANSADHQRTATEVAALKEEKMMVLGPVLDNVHGEVHKPMLDITFHYAEKAGLLPPPPDEIEGMEIEVEFISILAQAQKLVATSGIEQVAGFVGTLSAVYPEARHKFNPTEAIDEYAGAVGVSAKVINSDEEVAAMQKAEAQQAQMQQALAAGAATAEQAKVLSETDMGGNSALNALMGGIPQ
jgi:hypothetical protein